jgi:hypothetical protein
MSQRIDDDDESFARFRVGSRFSIPHARDARDDFRSRTRTEFFRAGS